MKSLLASVRTGGGFDRVDHAVQLLEDEWRKHGDVPLERLWVEQRRLLDTEANESVVLLSELVKTDLRCRFARGQSPTVAGYLERFPELRDSDSRVLSLIYEEFCLAEERGDRVDVDEFCDRYPRWKESLVSQLQYHHLFSQAAGVRPTAPPFPEVGDTFEEFQLLSLMGRGGTSRVFLARDLSLGGKQVVLKVSLDRGREPQAQGALDHPHIVPVNSVVFGDEGMRGLSMPYRPGLPLDEVIRRVDPASRPRRAMALWEALVRKSGVDPEEGPDGESALLAGSPTPGPRGDGWEGFPVRGTYPQGVAWVVKVIAEALHYAHGKQTFHRDVKPANVLLTVLHGPQLLDFNLAESPHSASQAQAAMHGGTLPYMAPEQIEAFLNPDLWGKVGAPADIYSLGLVLRELLTGQAPDLPAETLSPARAMRVLLDRRPLLDVSVRRSNPAIPHALEAIVARCLSVTVEDRYPDAGALAEDLGHFLHRKPLAHASNSSYRERAANWTVRNRLPIAIGAMLLSGSLALGTLENRRIPDNRPLVPIESSTELISAVAAFNSNHVRESKDPFHHLIGLYPRSSLPKLYLGLAYCRLDRSDDGERLVSDAFAMPDADRELLNWSSRDEQLAWQLDRFAYDRFNSAKSPLEKPFEDDRALAEDDRYRLASRAAQIRDAIKAAGGSRYSGAEWKFGDFDHARALQEIGEYEEVIGRADGAIESVARALNADNSRLHLLRSLYEWRRLRARALIKRAMQLRSEETDRLAGALQLLDRAEKDLQHCNRGMITDENMRQRERHGLEKIRLWGLITRINIELDVGRVAEARAHLDDVWELLPRYVKLAQLVDRQEDIGDWYARHRNLTVRLQQEVSKATAANPESAAEVTHNDSLR